MHSSNPITLIIAEDHEVCRDGLMALLAKDKEIKVLKKYTKGRNYRGHLANLIILRILVQIIERKSLRNAGGCFDFGSWLRHQSLAMTLTKPPITVNNEHRKRYHHHPCR